MDLHRLLRSLSLLILILGTYFSNAEARQHRHKHGRQRDKRFEQPGNFILDGGSGPDRGPWGPWTQVGSCSRTCGGGVTVETRTCLGGFCEGATKRYLSCNVQDCPDGSKEFRAEQCAVFNTEPFDDIFYDWIPYTKAPNKCELNCMPRGERFYYRHRDKVIDGTRCEEEKLDVCVEGKCLPVGCDMMLGSPAREDKCRECGGDNSGCNTPNGVLENQDLQVGYNDILLIPAGATNVQVRELKASNNYLAIRNVTGHYYLNGNWRIDFPRSLRFAGTIFHYERKSLGFFAPETITALGPTTEALYIVLLYQERNPGVEYEYSLPKGLVQETDPDSYVWVTGDFEPCSATCGGGTQQRKVWCARRKDSSEVSVDLCDSKLMPPSEGACATEPCSPQWALGAWAPCSQTCGPGGVKMRQVFCEQIVSNGRPSLIENSACEELHGPPPPTKEDCPDIPCPNWHIAPWSPCDKLCGEGKQRRKVHCYTKNDGRIEVLGDSACSPDKPQTEMTCQLKPCEGLDWITSEWSGCDDKCGLSFETREVHCATQKGQVYPDSFCHKYRIPSLKRQCENPPSCQFEWFTSQWSECSVKCGTGIQTRKVFCGTYEGELLKKVEDSNCDLEKKYEDSQNCTSKEMCKGHWFTGPWSACSKPCGGGEMTRKVLCLLENKTVPVTNCDASHTALSNEPCNNHACGDDEIVPVEPTHPISEEEEDVCEDYDYEDSDGSALLAKLSVSEKFEMAESITFTSTGDTGETSSFEFSSIDGSTSEGSKGTETDASLGSSLDYSGSPSDVMMSDYTYSPSETDTSVVSSSVGLTEESPSSSSESDTGSTEVTEETSISSESSTLISSTSSSSVSSSSISSSSISSSSDSYSSETTQSSILDLISSTVSFGLSSLSSSLSPSSTDSSTGLSSTDISSSVDTSSTDISSSSSSTTDISSSSTDISSSSSTDISSTSSSDTTETSFSSSSEMSTPTDTTLTDLTSSSGSTETDSTEVSSESTLTSEAGTFVYQQEVTTGFSSSESTTEPSLSSSSISSTVDLSSSSSDITSSSTESTTEIETSSSSISSSSISSESTSESVTDISSTEPSTSSETDFSTTELSTEESRTSFSSSLSTDEMESSASSLSSSSETTESLSSSSPQPSSTSESSSPSSLSSDESTFSSLSTTGYTDTATTVSYATDIWGTTQSTVDAAVTKEQKPMCKRKKKKSKSKEPKCVTSEFGCCSDNVMAAEGPFNKGCPQPTTCEETKFGCCSDGLSPALGKNNEGCPPSQCNETLFGCCPDGMSVAEGNDNEGCPEEVTLPFDCKTTQFGCCPDGIAPAAGQNFAGCFECEGSGECEDCSDTKYGCCPDGILVASGPNFAGCEQVTTEGFIPFKNETSEPEEDCANSTYGCCPDGLTPALGEDDEGCAGTPEPPVEDCSKSEFGCCPNGNSSATGPNGAGCPPVCPDEPYGCCDDNETPAHGPNKEGCCLNTPYGCCPDNILPALGPNLEGCGCHYSPYGCCPDNNTVARGYNHEGCGCQFTEHGCCPNKYSPAAGPNFQGCPCHTHQFGCCPDGVTRAKGPHLQGCGCENTEFGCCPDNHTPASGPDRNCTCEASQYGCCPDGETEAAGEHFEGCAEIPLTPGEQCTQPKDRGACRDFTVKWFFDTEYGGCARFWYGGCGGNDNRFRSQEECASTCVELKGREACSLPKIEGPCEGYYPTWYFDTERKQCGQFIYGGCLGNSNNFETREACHELCVKPDMLDACEQTAERGVCQGNFTRWYYDKESKSCQEFTYGGCKPNGNNFLTELSCEQKCLQPGRSRVADICTLPVEPGPCPGSVMRWYYDMGLESCKPFVYGGCQGNANRFRSESECQRYCFGETDLEPDECSLPRAQGSCSERIPRWFFDASENRCMPFYYSGCEGNGNRFETQELCETACPPKVEQDTCSLPVVAGNCHNYTEQWYYDVYEGRCRPFYYGGCGGNQNRFNTEIDCQRRCDQNYITPPTPQVSFTIDMCFLPVDKGPCTQSDALWYYDSHNGVCAQFIYGGCEGNANRFKSREECEYNCGNAQDICTLPRVVGPCSGSYQQWYYEPNTDLCQVFDYGGCQGNSNRFNSITECEQKCKKSFPPPQEVLSTAGPPAPPAKSPICYTLVDAGPCKAQIPAWYFNYDSGECQLFIYGGCQGNANRFDSEEQCKRHCGEFVDVDVCNVPVDVGPCIQNLRKWYFDAHSMTCQEFNYGGCFGSANRFSSLEECNSVCLNREEVFPTDNTTALSHIAVCKLPVDVGPCRDGYYKRWFFNEAHRTCEQFDYGGCAGNLNRFKSFQICIDFCASLAGSNEIGGKEECADVELACSRAMNCEYGIERWVDVNGCENCRCHNPCVTSDPHCPPNTTCSVERQTNEETGDIEYHAVCRPENKFGECPQFHRTQTECSEACRSDADCPGDAKCCYNGCGTSCVRPQGPVTFAPTTTGLPPESFNIPGASPPQIEESEPQAEAEEGDMVTLKCVAHGSPTPVITWYKGDQKLGVTGGRYRFLSDGTIQIIGLYRSDAGVYVCIANNSVGPPVRREFLLIVRDGTIRQATVIGEPGSDVVVTLGSQAILQCFTIGWPRPAVTWWRGSRMLPLKSEQYEQRRDHSLLLHSVTLTALGSYTCQAYNGVVRPSSWTVTLKAIGPVYSSDPNDVTYNQFLVPPPRTPPAVDTPVHPLPPPYRPYYPVHVPQPETQPPPTEPPTPEAPRVFVVPVKINISLEQSTFPVGSDISIPCDVDGYPVPHVTWYKDDLPIGISERVHITESSRLMIIQANTNDSGIYRCHAENAYSSADGAVSINVEGVYIHPNCTDNPFFANCNLIVKAHYCTHTYYAKFCCKSCTQAGQLPSHGPHLGSGSSSSFSSPNNLFRRRRSLVIPRH